MRKFRVDFRQRVLLSILVSSFFLSACEILELEIQPDGSLMNVNATRTAGAYSKTEEASGSLGDLIAHTPIPPTKILEAPTTYDPIPTKTSVGSPQTEAFVFKSAGNYGLSFDGVDDKVVVLNLDDSVTVMSNQITLEVWIYVLGVDNFVARILDHSDNQLDDRYVIGIYTDDGFPRIHLNINRNSLYSDPIDLNTWIHIAGTYDGQRMQLFINGELQSEKDVQTFISITESNLVVGHGGPHSQYAGAFYGILDEIMLWEIARTQDEIAKDSRGLLTGDEQGLIAYWPVEPGYGQFLEDVAGNLRARIGSSVNDEMDDPTWVVIEK